MTSPGTIASAATASKEVGEEVEKQLKIMVERSAHTASLAISYIRKLLVTAAISNALLLLICFSLFGVGLTIIFLLPIIFVPSIICYWLYKRLDAMTHIPEHFAYLQGALSQLVAALGDDAQVIERLNTILGSPTESIPKKIQTLIELKGELGDAKEKIAETPFMDIFLTIFSVANPGFAILYAAAIIPLAIWSLITLVILLFAL